MKNLPSEEDQSGNSGQAHTQTLLPKVSIDALMDELGLGNEAELINAVSVDRVKLSLEVVRHRSPSGEVSTQINFKMDARGVRLAIITFGASFAVTCAYLLLMRL